MPDSKKISKFLLDEDFIRFIYEDSPNLKTVWAKYFHLHPEDREAAEAARSILLGEILDYIVNPDQRISWHSELLKAVGVHH